MLKCHLPPHLNCHRERWSCVLQLLLVVCRLRWRCQAKRFRCCCAHDTTVHNITHLRAIVTSRYRRRINENQLFVDGKDDTLSTAADAAKSNPIPRHQIWPETSVRSAMCRWWPYRMSVIASDPTEFWIKTTNHPTRDCLQSFVYQVVVFLRIFKWTVPFSHPIRIHRQTLARNSLIFPANFLQILFLTIFYTLFVHLFQNHSSRRNF